jgi:hypothetical protein
MRQLSPAGQEVVNDIARRHGFSPDAVSTMLDAVMNGNGGMAQFGHPEFGGSGQWMRGGMTMIGDMFNNSLKGRVDALCGELSGLIANQTGLYQNAVFQSQSQSRSGQGQSGGWNTPVSLFVPAPGGGPSGDWWPGGLGWPNSTGAQNNVRYAWFEQARRLAIDVNGTVTVYDTLEHRIGGFSQQQSYGGSLTFTSQYGLVDVGSLPVVSGPNVSGEPAASSSAPAFAPPASNDSPPSPSWASSGPEADILGTIEKLAGLRGKGILSEEEFAAKKAELLSRL